MEAVELEVKDRPQLNRKTEASLHSELFSEISVFGYDFSRELFPQKILGLCLSASKDKTLKLLPKLLSVPQNHLQ